MSKPTEFDSFLKNSLTAFNQGIWHKIDLEHDTTDNFQSEIITQLKALSLRFDTLVEQNNSIALGVNDIIFEQQSHQDKLWHSYQNIQTTQLNAINIVESIAGGDFSPTIKKKHPNDDLNGVLIKVLENFRSTVNKAEIIAKGDYSAEVKPLSDKDALGKALFLMTQGLREAGDVCSAIATGDTSYKVQVKGNSDQLALAINQIAENLDETARQADVIAQGDYSAEVQPRSDKDALGNSLFLMTQSLREVGTICNAISSGDFSVEIQPINEKDAFRKSLLSMTNNLKEITEKNAQENWIKTGQAELANIMRGEQSVDELTEKIVTYVAKYTGANVGVFYLADEARALTLSSSYAFQRRKNLSDKILPGEGLVGQAVKEKQTLSLTNIPSDYICINSGLGNASPNNIIVIPIILEGAVKGAIELAKFGEFSDHIIELFERSNESIAVAINSAHDRIRMQDLLEEAQRSSEELQIQQEELRASNEELEEQTKTISKSEAELKAQQEELQASNEELEEKTEYLQRQKQEILDKNIRIEQSRSQLKEKAQELEVSSKYKSEFLANMSHELRTPLNSLLILAKLLSENKEGNLTPKQLESAEIIHRGGHDLLDLINDILDLSKVESGKLTLEIQNVPLNNIADSISSQFNPLIHDKDFKFSSNLHDNLPVTIETDQMRTLQILKNLLSNAFKFTLQGQVNFDIFVPDETVVFSQPHLNSQNCIGFSVRDTGIGIEKDKQRLIFEAFQQADGSTSRKFGGTGLGLTITRELCRLLGGELQIVSEYEKGSNFTIFLPIVNDGLYGQRNENIQEKSLIVGNENKTVIPSVDKVKADVKPIQQFQTLPAVETNGYVGPIFLSDDRDNIYPVDRSVLIVEDDRDFASVLKGISHDKEYKILIAGDGKSALHLAAKYLPSAIILDLGLPDLDGFKVLELFKSDLTTRHIPVHVISGREGARVNALHHGAIGVLQKPTSAVELDSVFTLFEQILSNETKNLLIIDDDDDHCASLRLLLDNDGIEITTVNNAEQGIMEMEQIDFDCVVLDLGLPGISGHEFLEKMHQSSIFNLPPVVINTGIDLDDEQYKELNRYTDKIILKGTVSNERLLDEVMLFLHQTALSLPEKQKKAIQMLHNEESFFDGRTVLLVDDDLRNTFALSTVLEEKGLNVIIAENGVKALEALDRHTNIEVVLMDIMMPVMDGYEAMRKIREQEKFQKLPIIALTAKAMAEDRNKCIDAGANDYMNKPIKTDELLALLKVSIT